MSYNWIIVCTLLLLFLQDSGAVADTGQRTQQKARSRRVMLTLSPSDSRDVRWMTTRDSSQDDYHSPALVDPATLTGDSGAISTSSPYQDGAQPTLHQASHRLCPTTRGKGKCSKLARTLPAIHKLAPGITTSHPPPPDSPHSLHTSLAPRHHASPLTTPHRMTTHHL